jgi:hypothetical protein
LKLDEPFFYSPSHKADPVLYCSSGTIAKRNVGESGDDARKS